MKTETYLWGCKKITNGIKLARFVSKGLIRPIAIPTVDEESERALLRRRHQITNSIRRCKQRIKA